MELKDINFLSDCCNTLKVHYNENSTDVYKALGSKRIFTTYEMQRDTLNGMVYYTSQDGATVIAFCEPLRDVGKWVIAVTNGYDNYKPWFR